MDTKTSSPRGSVRKDGDWAVFDLNAKHLDPNNPGEMLPRVHESRPGVTWPLRANMPCYMPQADARVFLKDPSFKVVNENEDEVPPLVPEQRERNVPAMLSPHMVIANLAELTTDALLTRVAQMRGGARYNSTSSRERVIDFITEQQGLMQAERKDGDAGVGDHEVDDIDDAEASRILARAA
jgi:hypothetical protein